MVLISAIVIFVFAAVYSHIAGLSRRARQPAAAYQIEPIKSFTFPAPDCLKEWDEKVFKGKVTYEVRSENGQSYVSALSDASASALYYQVKVDAKTKYPVVRWKWKAEKFPVKKFEENLDKENEDDFAARFYVIFPALFITNSRVLEYVWAEKLAVGATGTSPYSKNIKLIVLRSGKDEFNQWLSEERDVVADYIKMFGRAPDYNIGAIAFMTNTEHTQGTAEAKYDDIEIGYKVDIKKEGGRTP